MMLVMMMMTMMVVVVDCPSFHQPEKEKLGWGWRREAGSWFQRQGEAYRKERSVIGNKDDIEIKPVPLEQKSDDLPIQLQRQQQPFYGPLSGTTRVSRYQNKHSPTHHPGHHPVFISFFHLPRSIASSLFKLRAWQSFCTTWSTITPSYNCLLTCDSCDCFFLYVNECV